MKRKTSYKRKKKQQPIFRNRSFWAGLSLAVLAASLSYLTVFSSWVQVRSVNVTGTNEVSKEAVLEMVEQRVQGTWLGFPTASIFLFGVKEAEQSLLDSFPILSAVSVKRSFSRILTVEVTERVQAATWCQDSSCVALDRQGVAFKETDVGGSDSYPVFQAQEFYEVRLGQELLDPSLLALLLDFRAFFERSPSRLLLAGFELGPGGQVAGITRDGWLVLLDVGQDIVWQQTKLELVLEQQIPEARKGDLEYVDLRFGDQAYIKYRD